MKYISYDDAMERKVFSRDLRDYVVTVRDLNSLKKVEINDNPDETDHKEMLRILFNRCCALTGPQMCFFCGLRKECDTYRSVHNNKGDEHGKG